MSKFDFPLKIKSLFFISEFDSLSYNFDFLTQNWTLNLKILTFFSLF